MEKNELKLKKHFAVAIDGPAGAGKTSMAKLLSQELGFVYVDTGALYRAFAVHKLWLQKEMMEKEPENLPVTNEMALRTFDLDFERDEKGEQIMKVWGENINLYLRTEEVSMEASTSSADPQVRAALLELQRRQSIAYDVVMEGRDIGTVVLPDAQVKIFLTATPMVRAKRRYYDLMHRGERPVFENVFSELLKRDEQDTTRAACPLKQAEDAVLVDSTELNPTETLEKLLEIVRNKLGVS